MVVVFHDLVDTSATSSAGSVGSRHRRNERRRRRQHQRQRQRAAGSTSSESSTSSSFIELVDLQGYQLVVPLSESEIVNVHVGQIATVTVEALEGRKFAAHVVSVAVLSTSNSGVGEL